MPFFAYKGRNARGELVTGTLEDSDSGAVADQLVHSGISPVDITETSTPIASRTDSWIGTLFAQRITLDDRLLHAFCRLLQKVVDSSDWDLTLSLPHWVAAEAGPAARTIN